VRRGGDGLRIPVVELRRRTAQRRRWQSDARLDDVRISDTRLDTETPVVLDLLMESVPDGVVVTGEVRATWAGPCHRCMEPVSGEVAVTVREVFEPSPTEGESYHLGPEQLDLEPMLRDAVALELPLAPPCPHGDADPCPLSGYSLSAWAGAEEPSRDPRWSALEEFGEE
jgi:uncharacterized protein